MDDWDQGEVNDGSARKSPQTRYAGVFVSGRPPRGGASCGLRGLLGRSSSLRGAQVAHLLGHFLFLISWLIIIVRASEQRGDGGALGLERRALLFY